MWTTVFSLSMATQAAPGVRPRPVARAPRSTVSSVSAVAASSASTVPPPRVTSQKRPSSRLNRATELVPVSAIHSASPAIATPQTLGPVLTRPASSRVAGSMRAAWPSRR